MQLFKVQQTPWLLQALPMGWTVSNIVLNEQKLMRFKFKWNNSLSFNVLMITIIQCDDDSD
jgi:hypothetical protein